MKIFFSLIGIFSLYYILNDYGFTKIGADISSLGWISIPLLASFLPVLILYAFAWYLVTPHATAKIFPRFIAFTIISIAWNNLSPFLKVLGEPVKVFLLERSISRKDALKSVLLYNLVHTYGTIGAFIIGALIILFRYNVPSEVRIAFTAIIIIFAFFFLALLLLPQWMKRKKLPGHRSALSKASFWIRWSFSKIRIYYRDNPFHFWLAILSEVAARFVEGITFYIAFHALGEKIHISQAALLDVGRALMDNAFFFIPYQVGSREAVVIFLCEKVLAIESQAAISAALFYRLVEIAWIGIGYILWMKFSKSRKFSM